MNRKVALIISSIFHPVFINLISLLLLFVLFPVLQFGLSDNVKLIYILFIFVTTGILPLLIVLLMKVLGKISSLLIDNKDERTLPYIITSTIYLLNYYLFMKVGAPQIIVSYLLGCSTITVAVLIINLFYKISIHTSALGALSAVIVASVHQASFDIRLLLIIIFIITGITASARIYAESHNQQQLYMGFLTGTLIMFFIL